MTAPTTAPNPSRPAAPVARASTGGSSAAPAPAGRGPRAGLGRVLRALRSRRDRLHRRPRHVARSPRLRTPARLRLAMGLLCLPVALFAVAVHVAVARNDRAVATLGRDATVGVTLAQRIELELAQLDEIAVHRLVVPAELGSGGLPDDYNAKRQELQSSLMLAVAEAPAGPAYRQRLEDIDYALGHYHALVREAFAARDRDDTVQVVSLYGQAHLAMADALRPGADAFDHASAHALDAAYERRSSHAASMTGLVWVSWLVLLVALVAVQAAVARKFRRAINLALATATLLGAVSGFVAITRLEDSSSHLASAHERALDAVHVLAEARTAAVATWQAEGQLLLDPAGASAEAESAAEPQPVPGGFAVEASKLFRVGPDDDLAASALAGEVPDGAGGYLATVIDADVSEGSTQAVTEALTAFGGVLRADAELRQLVVSGDIEVAQARYDRSEAHGQLVDAIDRARAIDQDTFDAHADEAAHATRSLGWLNAVAALAVTVLVLLGLYERLREYKV